MLDLTKEAPNDIVPVVAGMMAKVGPGGLVMAITKAERERVALALRSHINRHRQTRRDVLERGMNHSIVDDIDQEIFHLEELAEKIWPKKVPDA